MASDSLFCLFPFVDLLERVAKEWGLLALFTGARVVERIARPLIAMASLPGAPWWAGAVPWCREAAFWLKNEFRSSREGPVGRETSFGVVKSLSPRQRGRV